MDSLGSFQGMRQHRFDQPAPGRLEHYFPFLCINRFSLLAEKSSGFDIPPFDMYVVAGNDDS
jgi:hypothetical protein